MTEARNSILRPPPTEEQEEIRRSTRESGASLMIDALAGTGKTTTLELAGKEIKGPALALAFNKSIAVELAKRFAPNFETKTMNGFGHGALARMLPGVRLTIESRKLGKIVTEEAKRAGTETSQDDWEDIKNLAVKAQTAGLKPGEQDGLIPDSEEEWRALADDLMISEGDFAFVKDFAWETLRRNNELTRTGLISFDDQIYYPTLFGGKFPLFPNILVDEGQDINELNRAMIERSLAPKSRLILCGDPRQSIYMFRGSMNESMERMRELRSEWTNLPLTLTFRCPKKIVERQQHHAPGYRAWHLNPDGAFERWKTSDEEIEEGLTPKGWDEKTLMKALPTPRASLAVLCRNNGPLLSLTFKLLSRGVSVVMLGRDIGKGLIALSRKIEKNDGVPIDLFLGKLQDWEESERSIALAMGKEEKVAGVTDRAECLRAVAFGAKCRDSGELRAQLEKLFARESGSVTLGSIHRSKGLEWDCVLHLDSWRIPSKQARRAAMKGDDRALKQEWNLKYVCETRTKHTLIEANLEDFNADA